MLPPRVVVVRRRSEYEQLVAAHATRSAVEFFLRTRGESIDAVEVRHELLEAAHYAALAAVPPRWRRAEVLRDELSRFLFEPEDVVVCVGQDGLVANVAKYLAGQPVVGRQSRSGDIRGRARAARRARRRDARPRRCGRCGGARIAHDGRVPS